MYNNKESSKLTSRHSIEYNYRDYIDMIKLVDVSSKSPDGNKIY